MQQLPDTFLNPSFSQQNENSDSFPTKMARQCQNGRERMLSRCSLPQLSGDAPSNEEPGVSARGSHWAGCEAQQSSACCLVASAHSIFSQAQTKGEGAKKGSSSHQEDAKMVTCCMCTKRLVTTHRPQPFPG